MAEKPQPTIAMTAEQLQGILAEVLKKAQTPEWQSAMQPFEQAKKSDPLVTRPSTESKTLKTLVAIKTGTFLDDKFFDGKDKPIGGIPFGSSTILTGLPNSGKSIFMEELALRLASEGHKVCYTITEEIFSTDNARYDLETRLKEKAIIMKLDWAKVAGNLFVLDTVAHAELRSWENFVPSYKALVEDSKVDILLVDSMTLLEDSRGQIKYRVLEFMRYNQLHGVTSLLINQRAIEESDSLAMAGGIGISHIVDIVFILDYKKVSSWDGSMKMDLGAENAKQGAIVNFMRILKCRVCRFDAHYFGYAISKDGFVCQTTTPPQPVPVK